MTPLIAAALCILVAVWLWKSSSNFTVDAAPIGSMMMVGSLLLCVVSVFLFGIQIGKVIYQ